MHGFRVMRITGSNSSNPVVSWQMPGCLHGQKTIRLCPQFFDILDRWTYSAFENFGGVPTAAGWNAARNGRAPVSIYARRCVLFNGNTRHWETGRLRVRFPSFQQIIYTNSIWIGNVRQILSVVDISIRHVSNVITNIGYMSIVP